MPSADPRDAGLFRARAEVSGGTRVSSTNPNPKKVMNHSKHSQLRTLGLAALLGCVNAGAMIVGPYVPDPYTLHLWHLDETNAPAVDAVMPGGTNLTVAANGATLGNESHSGFGSALSTLDTGQEGIAPSDKDAYLAPRALVNGAGDNTSLLYADPVTGAFTMEAIVRIDFDPAKSFASVANGGNGRAAFLQLITGDDESNGNRAFQFRIVPIGVSANNPTVNLEFINVHLAVAPVETIGFPIPTTGPDAIVSNGWYHVAVTYDGNAGALDNIRFYWTALDSSRTAVSEIGVWSMQNDVPLVSPDFAIGNIGRNPANGSFLGLIDEVRISKVARQTVEMMFAPAEVTITKQPVDVTVGLGQPAELSVNAVGQSPIYYQWRHFGTNLVDATNATLVIPAALAEDAGQYDVVVTNSLKTDTSSPVTLTVRTPINLVWNPAASADWNTMDVNWDSNGDLLADLAFQPGDNVRFDSQGIGLSYINLVGTLTPTSVTVDADADYTFTTLEWGAIGSNARLTKRGGATLVIDTDNSFTGPTVIEGGTLQVGAGTGRGTLGNGAITNNAALVFNRTGVLNVPAILAGTGSLTNNGAGVINLTGTNSLTGPIALNAGGISFVGPQARGNPTSILLNATLNSAGSTRLVLSQGVVLDSGVPLFMLGTSLSPDWRCGLIGSGDATNVVQGPIVVDGSGSVTLSADTLSRLDLTGTISGSTLTGALLLRGGGQGNIYGKIDLPSGAVNKTDGGVWTIWSTGNVWTNTALVLGTLRLGVEQALPANLVLRMGQANSVGVLDLNGFNQRLAGLTDNAAAGTKIIGNDSTNSDSLLSLTTSETWLFSGVIQDGISNNAHKVSFSLAGGTLILTNVSTYSGDTTITAGTLMLTNLGSIANSANLILANGAALHVADRADGTLTLTQPQTLKGNGAFNVIGNLASQGTIELKLNKSGSGLANDSIHGLSQMVFGGTLRLLISGEPLSVTDSFKLFHAAGYTGAFDVVGPAPGPGLAWDTSTMTTDGTLRIKTGPDTTPPDLVSAVIGGGATLQLSWPASHIGWELMVQTNTLTIGLSNNWVRLPDSSTTNAVYLPLDPANGAVFFRLTYP